MTCRCIEQTVRAMSGLRKGIENKKIADEYFDDLGIAYRAEIQELYELGCRKCV